MTHRDEERGAVRDTMHQGWVARQRPRPTLRQYKLPLLGAKWRPWHLTFKLSLSEKAGLHGRSFHPTRDAVSACIILG